MRIVRTIKHLRREIAQERQSSKTIGFVPTMGSLHEGHLSLVRQAKKDCDCCVVSIYVNPRQFDSKQDLIHYPRRIKEDAAMMAKENVDILFIPSDNIIYPQGYLTYVDVKKISSVLCGRWRPGHFKGVATIVAKLLNIVGPDVMYLGQKDAQQAVVLKRLALDLNFSVRVRVMPTIREKDGLAMSSRNVRLSSRERLEAPGLYRALQTAAACLQAGETRPSVLTGMIRRHIRRLPAARIQYAACVDADTLEPLKILKGKVLIALSVFFGKTRLIDNVIVCA